VQPFLKREHSHMPILFFVAWAAIILAWPALAHESWISKGGHRNSAGEWCCGDGDCGVMTAGKIVAAKDGWHVNAVFTMRGAWPAGDMSFGLREFIPYSEAQPSPDGAFWACRRPDGSRRCFFAPPPST
jgi:hypothetical protein